MLTITAALPWEAKAARAGQAIAGRGRVRIITSGVGPQRAREAAEEAIEAEPSHVISIGVAGGLTNTLRRPSITLPTSTIRQSDGAVFQADEQLRKQTIRLLNKADIYWQSVTSITTPEILFTRPEKRAAADSGAEIVQMEDAEWAEICAKAEIPFAAVRVVMDALDDDIPNEVVRWRGKPSALDIAVGAFRRPGLLPELLSLGMQRQSAMQELERAMTLIIPAMVGDNGG
jgi:adenosylhomocysteine nucleosidase